MSPLRKLLVDVHTHVYLPRYASVLRSRSIAPRIFTRNTPSGQSEDRLLILDDEPSGGRPVGGQVRHSPNYDIVSNDAVDSTGTEMRRSNSWTGTGSISPSSGTPHLLSSSSQLVDRATQLREPLVRFPAILRGANSRTAAECRPRNLLCHWPRTSIRCGIKTALRVRPLATRPRCPCRVLARSSLRTRSPTSAHPGRHRWYARGWLRAG